MEEIEVEEYVRTEKGIIFVYTEEFSSDLQAQDFSLYNNGKIIKHSKNIKGLLKVGDYINGSKLLSIDYAEDREGNCDKLHYYYSFEDSEKDVNEYYEELNIKSIVTSEQFKNIEYKI